MFPRGVEMFPRGVECGVEIEILAITEDHNRRKIDRRESLKNRVRN